MSSPETESSPSPTRKWFAFSPWRTLVLFLIFGAGAIGYFALQLSAEHRRAKSANEEAVNTVFGLIPTAPATLADRYSDADGDLIADTPSSDKTLGVDVLQFSYLPGSNLEIATESWVELTDALSEATGLKVETREFGSVAEQLAALEDGQLHITAFNTGSVTTAVNHSGFVPVSTLAGKSGPEGYSAKIIVRDESPVESPSDLSSLMFTSPASNSGFRYPLLILAKDFQLFPDRDYVYRFSQSHELSIRAVVAGDVEAAAVASDVLEIVREQDGFEEHSVRAIFESSNFPAACFGYQHALDAKLADDIRSVLESFEFTGTALEQEFEGSGYVKISPINFKDDFSEIRLIEEVIRGRANYFNR